uniref:Uncharacterized protein n=1 Tax=Rhizophora mucronata TaxID=61149 RepID=A0A2P2PER9_RHIMU
MLFCLNELVLLPLHNKIVQFFYLVDLSNIVSSASD